MVVARNSSFSCPKIGQNQPPKSGTRHNYNSWKVLKLIATERAGSTYPGDTYLSSFPENYYDVSICPIIFVLTLLTGISMPRMR